ncbi:MAG: helix-turn-helix domain-containing protein [Gemmatimonadaceae bacterium]
MTVVKIAPIRGERDYEAALKEIEGLMDAAAGTSAGDHLDVLVTLVEAYEAKHWAIDPPDPIDAIGFRLEQRGLSRSYLQKILCSSGRVSEIMNRKRSLSIEMMRRLHEELNIPAGSFLRRPTKRGAGASAAKRRRKTA